MTLVAISYCILTLVVLTTSVMMSIALIKFVRIVSSRNFRRDLNRAFVFAQIISLVVWVLAWMLIGIEFLYHIGDLDHYDFVKTITIVDIFSMHS